MNYPENPHAVNHTSDAIPSPITRHSGPLACHPERSEGSPYFELSLDQFRQLLIAALEDSPRAREIVRQAFLPAFPVQGGTPTQNYIPVYLSDLSLDSSIIYQSGTKIGINTNAPTVNLDVNGNVVMVGTKTAAPGNGGTMRLRDDTGTVRWLFGIPGSAGSQDFFMYNYTNGRAPIFIQNGAASYSLYMSGSGFVGVLTSTPSVRLDVRTTDAKSSSAGFENILQAASNESSGPLALRAGIKTDPTTTNRYGAIEVDDASTKRPLALQPNGGGVVIGGTLTRQVSGGPEKLGFQDTSQDAVNKVCVANFVGSEQYARFLLDMKGNMEWAGSTDVAHDVDQNVLLGWLSLGRLQCQGVAEGGFSIHAWKHSTLTAPINTTEVSIPVADISQFANASYMVRCENELIAVTGVSGNNLVVQQPGGRGVFPSTAASHAAGTYITRITGDNKDEAHARIAQNFDGSGVEFSDGATPWDVSISRPSANQLNVGGNPATSPPTTASLGIEMAVPGTPGLTAFQGSGSLSGTYYYRITAFDAAGGETAAGGENTVNVSGLNNAVTVSWGPVVGAVSFRVYRGTSAGAEDTYHTYTGTDNTYTDNGGGTSGRPPAATKAYMAKVSANAILVPRLTTTERGNLTPVNGMIIYNTTTNQFEGYANGGWVSL